MRVGKDLILQDQIHHSEEEKILKMLFINLINLPEMFPDSTLTFSNIPPGFLRSIMECPPHMSSEKPRNLLGTYYDLFYRAAFAQTCGPTESLVEGTTLYG